MEVADDQYGPEVTTKICLIDFALKSDAGYERLAAACEGLDIGVLGVVYLCSLVYPHKQSAQ